VGLASASMPFDTARAEQLFAAKTPSTTLGKGPGGKGRGSGSAAAGAGSAVVQLVDSKRSYTVNIVLARLRQTPDAIVKAVLNMDSEFLSEETASQLISVAPTAEEIQVLQSFTGPTTQLGRAEAFFLAVGAIPRFLPRLEFSLFRLKFPGLVEDVENSLKLHERAVKTLRYSSKLKRAMLLVLEVGNFLNSGTRKGEAYGFALNTLSKLVSTKSTDNKVTLMMFIAEELQRSSPDVLGFVKELEAAGIKEAARVETTFLESSVRKLESTVKRLGQELETHANRDTAADKFLPVMESFHSEAAADTKTISYRLAMVQEDGDKLRAMFGVGKSDPIESIFASFNDFVENFKRAVAHLAQMKEREAKQAQAASSISPGKKAGASEPSSKEPVKDNPATYGADETGVVDKVLGSVMSANAGAIAMEIRKRRMKT